MALTVGVAACAIVYDIIMVSRGMYERTGLDGLFYYFVVFAAVYSVVAELNLWFDVAYFVSDKSKKRKYKTVFHMIGLVLVPLITVCLGVLVIIYIHVLSVATGTLAVALGVTRIAHFVVFVVRYDDDKKDNNISKEIDTQ